MTVDSLLNSADFFTSFLSLQVLDILLDNILKMERCKPVVQELIFPVRSSRLAVVFRKSAVACRELEPPLRGDSGKPPTVLFPHAHRLCTTSASAASSSGNRFSSPYHWGLLSILLRTTASLCYLYFHFTEQKAKMQSNLSSQFCSIRPMI